LKNILQAFGIDAIYGCDWETYWAQDYTLSDKKRGTTEYVTDARFEAQIVSVQKDTWAAPRVMEMRQFRSWAAGINWQRAGFLAHHAHFDGLIASHHFGIKPRAYFDTLSMARPIMPVQLGGSLKRVCEAFGRKSKQHAEALINTKGKRWAEFTKAEKAALKVYAGDDIEDCWFLFHKMLPFYSIEELRLIDLTVKMYAQPSLLLDKAGIEQVLANEHARKDALTQKVGVPKTHLTSKDKFAVLLREAGVEPPSKISKKQSEKAGYDVEVLAMSKQDQEFKDLMGHPSERVRDLVAARFDLSSNQMVSRCTLLLGRAHLGPQPVYLNYYGAKTGRWSGGDNANWQNLSSKRKEGGAELRASVHAPPGYMLIIADLAQIEARLTAWFAGQQNKVDAFRAYDAGEGPDVYRLTAADVIYNKPIDKVTDLERFVGKTCELALGFQAGWKRLAATFRIGAFGPPMPISDEDAQTVHKAWRSGNQFIVADWRQTQSLAMSAFAGRQRIDHNVVTYEGTSKGIGWMHLPGGMAIRYDGLEPDEEGKLSYISAYRQNKVAAPTIERTRLYGGILVENRIQALARRVIGEHMLHIKDELKDRVRIAMSTHDEIVGMVPARSANKALAAFKAVMSTPPPWAPDLPLAVDAHISARYDK
jgi:DNA polymerase